MIKVGAISRNTISSFYFSDDRVNFLTWEHGQGQQSSYPHQSDTHYCYLIIVGLCSYCVWTCLRKTFCNNQYCMYVFVHVCLGIYTWMCVCVCVCVCVWFVCMCGVCVLCVMWIGWKTDANHHQGWRAEERHASHLRECGQSFATASGFF